MPAPIYNAIIADSGDMVSTRKDPNIKAVLANGDYVIVSEPAGTAGPVILQRYLADGTPSTQAPVGAQANTTTSGARCYPGISALEDGGFVVRWTSYDEGNPDDQGYLGTPGKPWGIFQQVYDSSGARIGVETPVNTMTQGDQWFSTSCGLADGGWVVAWVSELPNGSAGIFQRVYNADGTATTLVETQVSTSGLYPKVPSIAALADGGWVVTWEAWGPDNNADGQAGIVQQIYNANGDKLNGQTVVNTTTAGHQNNACVSSLANGGWVVTWDSSDGSGSGIYQQAYHANGNKNGDETLVNLTTSGSQSESFVTANADGSWTVNWYDSSTGNMERTFHATNNDVVATQGSSFTRALPAGTFTDGDMGDTLIYSATGLPAGLAINSTTGTITGTPQAGGTSVITIIANDGNGGIASGSFNLVVDTTNTAPTYHAIIAETGEMVSTPVNPMSKATLNDGSGDYVIVGTIYSSNSNSEVFYQRYHADDTAVGNLVQVNTFTANEQLYQSISALADGGFVVTWTSQGQDGSGDGIYQQAYNNNGTKLGGQALVNTFTTSLQQLSRVAALTNGGWVVTWQSWGQDDINDVNKPGIYQQAYHADGSKNGGEEQVNTYTTNYQEYPNISSLANGGWVVAWESWGQDGSGYGIYQQAYNSNGTKNGGETLVNVATAGISFIRKSPPIPIAAGQSTGMTAIPGKIWKEPSTPQTMILW